MIMHTNEVLGPEHLRELGSLFDKACEILGSGSSEWNASDRAQLARILLHLYGLRQLGPDQLIQTALRVLKQSMPERMSYSEETAGVLPELVAQSSAPSKVTSR